MIIATSLIDIISQSLSGYERNVAHIASVSISI